MMSKKQANGTTCDLCFSVSIENEGSLVTLVFFSYQDINICQYCCRVLQKSKMVSPSAISAIMDNYNNIFAIKTNTKETE